MPHRFNHISEIEPPSFQRRGNIHLLSFSYIAYIHVTWMVMQLWRMDVSVVSDYFVTVLQLFVFHSFRSPERLAIGWSELFSLDSVYSEARICKWLILSVWDRPLHLYTMWLIRSEVSLHNIYHTSQSVTFAALYSEIKVNSQYIVAAHTHLSIRWYRSSSIR